MVFVFRRCSRHNFLPPGWFLGIQSLPRDVLHALLGPLPRVGAISGARSGDRGSIVVSGRVNLGISSIYLIYVFILVVTVRVTHHCRGSNILLH